MAIAPGPVTISATFDGITATTGLTVTSATLKSITVTPANTNLPAGETEQLTATGTLSDNSTEDLTSQVTWASSDTTWITISNTGLATSVSPGPVTISATFDGITGTTGLTATAAALESIAITPANTSIAKGLTQQLTATGVYSDGSTAILNNSVTWMSANTTVATISTTGLASTLSTGSSEITATDSGVSGTTTLTVTAAVVTSIVVTPNDPSILELTTQPFTATGTFTDGTTANLSSSAYLDLVEPRCRHDQRLGRGDWTGCGLHDHHRHLRFRKRCDLAVRHRHDGFHRLDIVGYRREFGAPDCLRRASRTPGRADQGSPLVRD